MRQLINYSNKVLLSVLAHPDDETFANGGTLARYAAAGAAVHVIIGTDGIAGSVEDPAHLASHHTLAQIRSAELADAVRRVYGLGLFEQVEADTTLLGDGVSLGGAVVRSSGSTPDH